MTSPTDTSHSQDHFRWRHDHLEALSILKRAESAIFAYQARILAHEAEIERHEDHIAHGETPPAGEHAHFTEVHPREHNDGLIAAIRALGAHLERTS